MGIRRAISRAMQKRRDRGWDKTYWAIDLHDTIINSTYKSNHDDIKMYWMAGSVLRELSRRPSHVLILFTSSHDAYLEKMLQWFDEQGIHFNHVNCNPECPTTELSDFSKKFYFDIIVEDKAGFDPLEDWGAIWTALKTDMDPYVICSECDVPHDPEPNPPA